jgi:hypothetical protein
MTNHLGNEKHEPVGGVRKRELEYPQASPPEFSGASRGAGFAAGAYWNQCCPTCGG